MQNLEGKQIVHALHGRDGRAQFQLGGGGAGLENLHGRCEFVGGGVRGLLPLENFEMWRLGNGIFNILNDIFL